MTLTERAIALNRKVDRAGTMTSMASAMGILHEEFKAEYEKRFGYPYVDDDARFPERFCRMCDDTGVFHSRHGVVACECLGAVAAANAPFDPDRARVPRALRVRYSIWSPNDDARDLANQWLEAWPPSPPFLTFVGDTGVGKSQLAATVLAEVWERYKVYGQWWSATEIKLRFNATYDNEYRQENTEQVMRDFTTMPLLIIDDLGAAKVTDDSEEKLFSVINLRHERQLATVITANIDGNGWERFHPRIKSRVLQDSIPFVGRDRRMATRRAG